VEPDRAVPDWESDVVLADGATVHVRALRSDDEPLVKAMYATLSDDAVYMRFFSPLRREMAVRLELDGIGTSRHVARVALLGGHMLGIVRYDVVGPGVGEVACVVTDDQQGRGLATLLLEHLAVIGRAQGLHTFVAETLAENSKMLNVFKAVGWERRTRFQAGVLHTEFAIDPRPGSTEAISRREHTAEAASMARVMSPRSVAVVGASPTPGRIGHAVMNNLIAQEFRGPLYPVNPTVESVAGLRAYASILDIPGPVDLAIVIRPAPSVLDLVDECAHKGVHALLILSAGFAELGDTGAALQREVVTRARANGMRVVGPNCLGIANTAPDVQLNATFAPDPPVPGNIAFLSQSGGIGIELLSAAARRGIGISEFVSAGNKADVSGNDLLQHWEDDPRTDVILLYLESFGNPRKFARLARRVSRRKPIVALKSGRTSAGSRGASSHTAALASSDLTVDALFRQAGVVRVDTIEELLDTAELLASQPLPTGSRVAIVGNAGGPGILAADACGASNLRVEEMPQSTQDALRDVVPAIAGARNPVDLGAAATPDQFAVAIEILLRDETVDGVIVVYAPPVVTNASAIASGVADAVARTRAVKPVVACFLGGSDVASELAGSDSEPGIPAFAYPEAAARALGRAAELARWRARGEGKFLPLADIDVDAARALLTAQLERGGESSWLPADDTEAMMRCAGIPTIGSEHVDDENEAAVAAEQLGFPVALKVGNPVIVHKTDEGGVHLGLEDAAAVRGAFDEMKRRFGAEMGGAVVQRMASRGPEFIVGVTQDPSFGPLLLFGSGGVAAELLADRALRILPMTDQDAHDLVRALRTSPLLFGYRGAPKLDVAALEDLIGRVAKLAEEAPEISEMDLNPVIVYEDGLAVVDVKVRVTSPPLVLPPEFRRMRD
jgi:acetate---CoA ligase (ADP-forming)